MMTNIPALPACCSSSTPAKPLSCRLACDTDRTPSATMRGQRAPLRHTPPRSGCPRPLSAAAARAADWPTTSTEREGRVGTSRLARSLRDRLEFLHEVLDQDQLAGQRRRLRDSAHEQEPL